jgi:RNA polymerase sigma-70 factor (ECF subfamily)
MKNRFIDEQRALQREEKLVAQLIWEAKIAWDLNPSLLTSDLLETLRENDRQLLTQRYLLGMNSEEIGRQLGIPAATVRSRLHLARKRLRANL